MSEGRSVGVNGEEEGEDEIELSLGLSIGGSFRKTAKPKSVKQEPLDSSENVDLVSRNGNGDVSQLNYEGLARSYMANRLGGDTEPERASECVDPQRKREIHALRRQEARKKREEKLRKGVSKGNNGGGAVDDKMWLEAQRLQSRARDREMRENEVNVAEKSIRKVKSEISSKEMRDLDLTLNNPNVNSDHNGGPNPTACSSSPAMAAAGPQYQRPPLIYVPFTNGFAYPYMVPCWTPNVGNEKINGTTQPAVNRSFQPYHQNSGQNLSNGCDSDHNSSKCGGNGNGMSNGSLVLSSSADSDYRSKSQQGGSTSDTGSHSCHSQQENPQLEASKATPRQGQSEHSSSSNHSVTTQPVDTTTNHPERMVPPTTAKPGAQNPSSEIQPSPIKFPIPTSGNSTVGSLNRGNSNMSNPPKSQIQSHQAPSLPQMPCVSTTGNGPDGKTITGFLYRYTNAEVSIICVCHGTSFTPAEFVEHAGGKDISHPLRHITVIPSALA